MPLTAADIKFLAADASGNRIGTVVQDGLAGNIWPAVSSADRSSGSSTEKTVYISATNTDTAAMLGASVALDEVPSDPAVAVYLGAGTIGTVTGASLYNLYGTATAASAVVAPRVPVGLSDPYSPASSWWTPYLSTGVWLVSTAEATPKQCLRRVLTYTSGTATLDQALPWGGPVAITPITGYTPASTRTYGYSVTRADTTASTVIALPFVHARPYGDAYVYGSSLSDLRNLAGHTRAFAVGDAVSLWHESTTSPATLTAGQTVNVGRTNIDQFALLDSTGAVVARAMLNGPSSSFLTPNFAAGTVVVATVTGLSQPLRIRHRIAHYSTVASVDYSAEIGLQDAVTRTFPTGSVLASRMPLGDLSAAVTLTPFAQQAWTKQWSDVPIGNTASLPYSGAVAVSNQGAEKDRYALVFLTATTFRVYSERYGQLADGSTTANYAPANAALGGALFTLGSAGWASSISVGTCMRFNTRAAAAAVRATRLVMPSSAAAGTTGIELRAHGSAG